MTPPSSRRPDDDSGRSSASLSDSLGVGLGTVTLTTMEEEGDSAAAPLAEDEVISAGRQLPGDGRDGGDASSRFAPQEQHFRATPEEDVENRGAEDPRRENEDPSRPSKQGMEDVGGTLEDDVDEGDAEVDPRRGNEDMKREIEGLWAVVNDMKRQVEEIQEENDNSGRKEDDGDQEDEEKLHRMESVALLGDSNTTDALQNENDSCESKSEAEEEEMDGEMDQLGEDVYSFLAASDSRTLAFWFAICIFLFQMVILTFNLVDLVGPRYFNIPFGVEWQVSASQVICLILTPAVQSDFIISFATLHDGYRRVYHPSPHLDSAHHGRSRRGRQTKSSLVQVETATRAKYRLSNLCRLVQGGVGIAVSFLLIVQSKEVVELYFNFAALGFISELDNVFFWLVDNGFILKQKLQPEALAVKGYVLEKKEPVKRFTWCLGGGCYVQYRNSLLGLIYVGLLTGWAIVYQQQVEGKMIAQHIRAEFGDKFNQKLGFYSGTYKMQKNSLKRHAEYVLLPPLGESTSTTGKFVYCEEMLAWVFVADDGAACDKSWLVRSPETQSHDVTATEAMEWSVREEETGISTPVDFFRLSSGDCFEQDDEEKQNECNGHGRCVEYSGHHFVESGYCVCDEGWFGSSCEFRDSPCPHIDYPGDSQRFPGLLPPSIGDVALPSEEQSGFIANGIRVFDRSVYYRRNWGKDLSRTWATVDELLLFTGRRWILTTASLLGMDDLTANSFFYLEDDLRERLMEKLISPANFSFVKFVSDAVDNENPRMQLDTPVGLGWYDMRDTSEAFVNTNKPIKTTLQCTVCNNTEDCNNRGNCTQKIAEKEMFSSDWGRCECGSGFAGSNCQESVGDSEGEKIQGMSTQICQDLYSIVPDCSCHESCAICGANGNDPYNCDVCKDGELATVLVEFSFFDWGAYGFGCCSDSDVYCPECHESCARCVASKLDNCVECAIGYEEDSKNADGTFTCKANETVAL